MGSNNNKNIIKGNLFVPLELFVLEYLNVGTGKDCALHCNDIGVFDLKTNVSLLSSFENFGLELPIGSIIFT